MAWALAALLLSTEGWRERVGLAGSAAALTASRRAIETYGTIFLRSVRQERQHHVARFGRRRW